MSELFLKIKVRHGHASTELFFLITGYFSQVHTGKYMQPDL